MNSPLRDESEDPDRDGAEELESAKDDASPDESAEPAESADDQEAPAASADEDAPAEPNPETLAGLEEGLAGLGDGTPDLGLVQGAGEDPEFDDTGDAAGSVRPVEFGQIDPSEIGEKSGSIEMLMDIKLPISVELGRTENFVRDILEYGTGSVIELDKMAGDPVDILVNGRLVAKGEVVVVDDHFGVRITLLLTPEERVRSLG